MNANVIQGRSSLFFWDTISDTFYRQVDLQDPLGTALLFHNGILYIFSGAARGVRVSAYRGGHTTETLGLIQESSPPLPGAVDAIGGRIFWGGYTDYPFDSASVWAMGYKDRFSTAIHNIINTDSVENNVQVVTCLKQVEQTSGSDSNLDDPLLVVGWGDNTEANDFGIDNKGSNESNNAEWRSLYYNVGKPFRIDDIIIPLGDAVAANHTLVVTLYVDDGTTTQAQTTINSTNFSSSEVRIRLRPTDAISGNNNFAIGLKWTGTRTLPVTLPIIVKGHTIADIDTL